MVENTSESRRLQLSRKFRELLGSDNVYFQPPESNTMHYPCIRYKRATDRPIYADNKKYINRKCYEVMVISRDPEEPVVDAINENFLHCRMIRPSYVADNLHHTVFLIYW